VIAAIADRKEAEVVEVLTQGNLIPNLVVLNSNVMTPTMWVEPFDAAGLPVSTFVTGLFLQCSDELDEQWMCLLES
jgi:hypothetical protein